MSGVIGVKEQQQAVNLVQEIHDPECYTVHKNWVTPYSWDGSDAVPRTKGR